MRLILLTILLICVHAFGQRDAAIWYFGNKAGLDFNSGVPIALLDSELNTTEGSSSVADKVTGQLLFYTEGTNIWNKNHQIMVNGDGLLGSKSSTQSAVIVPQPGNNNLYYVFTPDVVQAWQEGTPNGLNYSVVDISLNGGLGEVILKNIPMMPETSEKVAVVSAKNGEDFWIVTHYQNRFYAFKLTNAGVSSSPVISEIGPNIDDFENFRGAMKISPNGKKLAIAHCIFEPQTDGLAYVYDFNNETGIINNQVLLGDNLVYYGVEFSSDSSKLYFSSKTTNGTGATFNVVIEQFDVEASDVAGSRFELRNTESTLLSDLAGALQIAMDRKIYHAFPGETEGNLSVIEQPKESGVEARLRVDRVTLGGRSTSFGLPQYIASFFESFIDIDGLCEGDTTTFTVDSDVQVTSASWNFGDPSTGANNTSTDINPIHVFSGPGRYPITVTFEFQNRVPKTFLEFIEITPAIDLPSSLVFDQCDENNDGIARFNLDQNMIAVVGNEDVPFSFYNFFDDASAGENAIPATTSYENQGNNEVIYARVGGSQGCQEIIEITLRVSGNTTIPQIVYPICDVFMSRNDVYDAMMALRQVLETNYYSGSTVVLYLDKQDAFDQINPLTFGTTPVSLDGFDGIFYRVSNGSTCQGVGYVLFDVFDNIEEDNRFLYFCPSQGELVLSLENTYGFYEWSTGEMTPSITINSGGTYDLEITSFDGCSDTLQFLVEEIGPMDVSVSVNDFQQENSLTVSVNGAIGELQYSIDGGLTFQSESSFTGLVPGNYPLFIRDTGSCNIHTEIVNVRGTPRYFTPNSDGVHDNWHVNNSRSFQNMSVKIFDRYGKLLHEMTSRQLGWDGTYNGNPMPSGAYWYLIEYEGETFAGHFALIRRAVR